MGSALRCVRGTETAYAATTRRPGSTISAGCDGLLSMVTSGKADVLELVGHHFRASAFIDASGTTTARAFAVSSSAGRSDAVPASSST